MSEFLRGADAHSSRGRMIAGAPPPTESPVKRRRAEREDATRQKTCQDEHILDYFRIPDIVARFSEYTETEHAEVGDTVAEK
jgi:hypothetical protein